MKHEHQTPLKWKNGLVQLIRMESPLGKCGLMALLNLIYWIGSPGGMITVPYHLMLLDRLTWRNDYWTASPYVTGQFHLALLNRIIWRYWTVSPGSSERNWTVSESSIS